MSTPPESEDVERLARWVGAGGAWRVVARSGTTTLVALLTCDGGEEMERIASADAAFAAYVTAHADDGS